MGTVLSEHPGQVWGVGGGGRKEERGTGRERKEGRREEREDGGRTGYGKHLSPALSLKPHLWPASTVLTPHTPHTPAAPDPTQKALVPQPPCTTSGERDYKLRHSHFTLSKGTLPTRASASLHLEM